MTAVVAPFPRVPTLYNATIVSFLIFFKVTKCQVNLKEHSLRVYLTLGDIRDGLLPAAEQLCSSSCVGQSHDVSASGTV